MNLISPLKPRNKNRESGFTLLEMMIVMTIMAFISIGIYQATTETNRLRDILSVEGDFYNGIRLAMNIVQRDISLIYSPELILPPKPAPNPLVQPSQQDIQDQQALQSGDLTQETNFWSPAVDKTGVRPSHFIGTDSKLSFVSLSHLRIYKDAPESEFAKISYELKKDETPPDGYAKDDPGSVLVKTEDTNAFDLDDTINTFKHTFALIHGIQKIKYRYYRASDKTWFNEWDSSKIEERKSVYPDMIEIKIELKGPSRLSFEGTFQFRPEIPLRGLNPST